MSQPIISFKTTRKFYTVEGEDEGGEKKIYILREMTAADRDKYLDAMGSRMTHDEKGKPVSINKFEGMQADLLVRCLFTKEDDGEKSVDRKTIQGWPASAVSTLFDKAQEINHLGNKETAEEEAEAKND